MKEPALELVLKEREDYLTFPEHPEEQEREDGFFSTIAIVLKDRACMRIRSKIRATSAFKNQLPKTELATYARRR